MKKCVVKKFIFQLYFLLKSECVQTLNCKIVLLSVEKKKMQMLNFSYDIQVSLLHFTRYCKPRSCTVWMHMPTLCLQLVQNLACYLFQCLFLALEKFLFSSRILLLPIFFCADNTQRNCALKRLCSVVLTFRKSRHLKS